MMYLLASVYFHFEFDVRQKKTDKLNQCKIFYMFMRNLDTTFKNNHIKTIEIIKIS